MNKAMRNEKMDNLKGMLMIFVVLGHTLELIMSQGNGKLLYEWIYLFHMPFFVFVSGYFYHFHLKNIFCNLFYPYVIFQSLYLLFAAFILQDKHTALQYIEPYWLMWYLLAMVFWSFLMKLVELIPVPYRWIGFSAAIILALMAGFWNEIGRTLSLSRTIVFFPFFIAGRSFKTMEKKTWWKSKRMTAVECLTVLMITVYFIFHYQKYKNAWFYEAVSYQEYGYSVIFRFFHILIAFIMILFFMRVMCTKALPLLGKAGKNSMQVFLLHGFVIKLIQKYDCFQYIPNSLKEISAISFSVMLVFVLSRDCVTKIFNPFMKGKAWLLLCKKEECS